MAPTVITVFGSSAPQSDHPAYQAARILGQLLAERGFAVQTGGYSGVMAAASQGAHESGGHVIGVTSAQMERFRPEGPNRWVKQEVRLTTLRQRLLYLVDHCAAAIVMPGGIGTLSELALIWSFVLVGEITPRPIIVVGSFWRRTLEAFLDELYVPVSHTRLLTLVETPQQAVATLTMQLQL